MSGVGSLIVSLEANIAQYTSSLDKASAIAEQRMKQIDKSVGLVKTSLTVLGAAFVSGLSIDAVKSKIEGVIASAASMQTLVERTGATVEALSGLNSIAKLSNTDSESLATGLQKLAKSMTDAENGGNKTTAAFNAIGIATTNLKGKSPDELFKIIADRLSMYKDGAEKVVIAQVLLGKAGANLLPVLKDLAEVGDLQVKMSTAQAAAAKQFEQDVKRMQMASEALWKVLGFALLPTLDDLVREMLVFQTSSNGVKKSVEDMVKDNTIRAWAQDSAIAITYLVEALQGVIKLARAVAGSFEAVWADVKVGAMNATPGMLAGNLASGELSKQLEARNKIVKEANQRYIDLWNYNGTELSDALKKRFRTSNIAQDFGISQAAMDSEDRRHHLVSSRSVIDTSGLGNANKGPKDDPAKAYMEGIIKLNDALIAAEKKQLSTREQYLADFYQLQYISASDFFETKKQLIADELATELASYDKETAAAQQFLQHSLSQGDKVKAQEARNKISEIAQKRTAAEIDGNERLTRVVLDAAKAYREFDLATTAVAYQYGLDNAAAQFSIDLMGKSTLEIQQLTKAREIDLQLQARIHDLSLKGYKPDEMALQIARASADAEAQKQAAAELVTTAYNKQRDALFGAAEALRKYSEDASNAGAQVSQVITDSLKGLEDMLVTFFTTGKLSWQSLEQTIISGIMRIIVQEQMIKPLADYLNGGLTSGTGGGGLLGGFLKTLGIGGSANAAGGAASAGFGTGAGFGNQDFGGFFADGGTLQPGKWGWAGENGPEPIYGGASGVTVFPNEQAGGSGRPISVTNNLTITGPVDQRTQAQIAAAVGAATQRALARNT